MEHNKKIETLDMFKKFPPIVRKALMTGKMLAEMEREAQSKQPMPDNQRKKGGNQ